MEEHSKATTYGIEADTGRGLAAGLTEDQVWEAARGYADRLRANVFVYADGDVRLVGADRDGYVTVKPFAAATEATATPEATVAAIAAKHLALVTLATRNVDALDFHSVSVWRIEAALLAAYEAGARAAKGEV